MKKILFLFVSLSMASACDDEHVPKPRGFFRIDLPSATYKPFESNCPFAFEINQLVSSKRDASNTGDSCWFNLSYARMNATIHLSYRPITNNLSEYIEDSRALAYKHTVKAMDINEDLVIRDSARVFGMLYTFEGNTATTAQFYLTDSTEHFLRGALYFNVAPNEDSLKPVADYIKTDIARLIETIRWR